MTDPGSLVPAERIERSILVLRGHNVMLDADLAELYQVETKALNRAVKRNPKRFPPDFMFQLTAEEVESLRYHFGTSKPGRGGRRYLPYVFTEQGVAMLSSVLNSERAILVNVEIMRAFARFRRILATHADLAMKIGELEKKLGQHEDLLQHHTAAIVEVFEAIRQIITLPPPDPPGRQIGFK